MKKTWIIPALLAAVHSKTILSYSGRERAKTFMIGFSRSGKYERIHDI